MRHSSWFTTQLAAATLHLQPHMNDEIVTAQLRHWLPTYGVLEGLLHDQWELHHTVDTVTGTPAAHPFGHVVGLRLSTWRSLGSSLMERAWACLVFANLLAVISPYVGPCLNVDVHILFICLFAKFCGPGLLAGTSS